MNTGLTKSLNDSLSAEVQEFISRVKAIYSTHQTQFDHCGIKVFDSIMKLVIPNFKQDKANRNTILTNFVQTALHLQAQKNIQKKYCTKDVVQVSKNTKIFSSPGSAFVSHKSNAHFLNNNRAGLNLEIPMSRVNSPFQKIITQQIVKEETSKDLQNNKSEYDYSGKNPNGTKKQYKVYCPELKAQIVDYATKNGMRQASQKYHVSTSKISIWSKSFTKSKQTRGRKTVDPQMQDKVCEWLEEELHKGSILTQRIIRQKAKTISVLENFKASKGWLQKFFKRRPALFKAYSLNRQGNLENLQANQINKQQEEITIKQEQDQSQSVSSSQKE